MDLPCAYVTLLTKPSYLSGTLVLAHSLQAVGSKYPLVIMVTSSLPSGARQVLIKRGIQTREVQSLQPPEGVFGVHSHDVRFDDTWTKLRAFELTEFQRVVLLDSDMMVMKNMDELMTLEMSRDCIAAAHVCACNPRKLNHYPTDWIPENCAHTVVNHPTALPPVATDSTPRPYSQLNSGTVVLYPSKESIDGIKHFLLTHKEITKYTFPDQDLLSNFFKGKWKPLSWRYNALKTLRVIHPQEWSDEEVRCLHYILHDKPWNYRKLPPGSEEYQVLNDWWWAKFDEIGETMKLDDLEGWKLVSASLGDALLTG